MSAVPASLAGNGTRLSVVGAGRVGQTLAHLLVQKLGLRAHQVFCRQYVHAEDAAFFIGQGSALSEFTALSASDIWLIGVPDSSIENTANALAELAQRSGWPPAIAFHCSGFCASDKLAALRRLGWSVASVHPALNFANPAQALQAALAAANPADRIAVFGSFYTVGAVLEEGLPRLAAPHLDPDARTA